MLYGTVDLENCVFYFGDDEEVRMVAESLAIAIMTKMRLRGAGWYEQE